MEATINSPIEISIDDGVLEILFNRPPVNAIDYRTSQELGAAFVRLRDDENLRVAIVTAPGDRIFSAGWDLKSAVELGANAKPDHGPGGFAGLTELFSLDKPVIAAVNGRAIGGGFELVLACDLIVAAQNADFSLPEVALGVLADAGGMIRLPRRLPYAIAMELLLTGRRMTAEEAARYGLVNAVVPRDDLIETARRMARTIADGAPLSVQVIKQVVRGTEAVSVEAAYAAVKARRFNAHNRVYESEDMHEGPRAFVEKRKPRWKGR